MRASPFVLVVGFLIAVAVSPIQVAAQESVENFELSLFPPLQLRGEDSAIRILRLGRYNKNVDVRGLDIGVVNHNTGGLSKGLQYGVVGVVEGAFLGWQDNLLVNINQAEFL